MCTSVVGGWCRFFSFFLSLFHAEFSPSPRAAHNPPVILYPMFQFFFSQLFFLPICLELPLQTFMRLAYVVYCPSRLDPRLNFFFLDPLSGLYTFLPSLPVYYFNSSNLCYHYTPFTFFLRPFCLGTALGAITRSNYKNLSSPRSRL